MDSFSDGACFRFKRLDRMGFYGSPDSALIFGLGLHSFTARPFVEFGGAVSDRGQVARSMEGSPRQAQRAFGRSCSALAAVDGRCRSFARDSERQARFNPDNLASGQKARDGQAGTRLRGFAEEARIQAASDRLDDRRNESDAGCLRQAGRNLQDEWNRSSGVLVHADSVQLRDRQSTRSDAAGQGFGPRSDFGNGGSAKRIVENEDGTAAQAQSDAAVADPVASDGAGICLALVVESSSAVVLYEVDPQTSRTATRSAVTVSQNSTHDGHVVRCAWRPRSRSTDSRSFVSSNDGRAIYRSSVLSASSGRRRAAGNSAGLTTGRKSLVMRRGSAELLRPDAAGACGPNRRSPRRVTSDFLKTTRDATSDNVGRVWALDGQRSTSCHVLFLKGVF